MPGIVERLRADFAQLAASRRARVAAALAIGLMLWATVARYRRASRLRVDLVESKKQLMRYSPIIAQVEELEKIANALRTRLSVIQGLQRQRDVLPRILDAMPPGLEANQFAGPSAGRFSLTVWARTDSEISAWLNAKRSVNSAGAKEAHDEFVIVSTAAAGSGPSPAVLVNLRLN